MNAAVNIPEAVSKVLSRTELINGCMVWKGSKSQKGYARINRGNRNVSAHRWVYFQLHPDANRNLFVCHSCDNPSCVNPDHLWLGTHLDNSRDAVKKGRTSHTRQFGEANGMSKLTREQVLKIRSTLFHRGDANRMAREMGVSHGAIYLVRRGINWRNI